MSNIGSIKFNNRVYVIKHDKVNDKYYFGGKFTSVNVNGIDYPVGYIVSIKPGVSPTINTMAGGLYSSGYSTHECRTIYINGTDIYAGGNFLISGSYSIAKWNGSSWSGLGSGVNGTCWGIDMSGSELYACGQFNTIGNSISSPGIGKWNGTSWSAVGTGISSNVYTVAVSGGKLYVGGDFTTIGALTVNRIARWNGSSWSAMGSGANGQVSSIAIVGTDVYIGGSFTTVNSNISVNGFAKWNGSAWSSMGLTATDGVTTIHATDASNIYVATGVRSIISKWNGLEWSAIQFTHVLNGICHSILAEDDLLYVGGRFSSELLRYFGIWNGTSWVKYNTKDKMVSVFAGRATNRNVGSMWSNIGPDSDVQLNDSVVTGNIGIGTTIPAYKVDVLGDTRVTGTVYTDKLPNIPISDWSNNSTTVYTTNRSVGIGKSPQTALDISGDMLITSDLYPTTQMPHVITQAGIYDPNSKNKPISTIEHYGDLSCSTLVCDSISARCIVVGDNDKSLLHNNLEISGNARIDGILFNYNNIYEFRVDDLIYTDGTMPNQLSDSFVYIYDDMVVANSIYGTTTGGTTNRRILYFPDEYFDEKADKIFSNRKRMFVITKTGKVFAIGNNDNCSLGINGVTSASVNQLTRAFTRDASGNDLTNVQFSKVIITGINCRTTYALSVDGNLYACGENSNGQLANGTTTSTNSTTLKCPNRVDFSGVGLASGIVKDAVMGGETWSYMTNDTDMVTGVHSATLIVLTKTNEVWAAGYGNQGQNGQGKKNVNTLTRLVPVKTTIYSNLTDVSSIHVYSAFEPINKENGYSYGGQYIYGFIAITNIGRLYQWGTAGGTWNDDVGYSPYLTGYYISNLLNPNVFATYYPITGADKSVKRIWTSNASKRTGIFIQTTDNLVYSINIANNYNRFNIELNDFFNNTTIVLDNIYIISGYISDRLSLFAITHNNTTMQYTLWGVGYNKYGQLGIGNRDNIYSMTNTGIDSKYVQNIKSITGMNYDRYYTCLLLNDGHVLLSGQTFPLDGSSDVKPSFGLLS
jgi:alpha-tubulin suppressor-like RCC1 family protein